MSNSHSYLEYLRLKAIVSVLRYFDGEKPTPPRPDDIFAFTSRDGKRELRANVCKYIATRENTFDQTNKPP